MKLPFLNNPFAPRSYGELKKVTDRVYIFRNITNSSFVIGDDGLAVIDTQVSRPTAENLIRHIRSVTDKPVRYVINTHYHWDHTNGNQLFKDMGATIISSKLTKEFMVARQDRQKEFLAGRGFELGNDPLLPTETFEGERALDLGGQTLRLFFAGRAETDDATAIYVDREKVLMSGDTIMTGSFPIFGQPCWDEGLQGDEAWPETILKLMRLEPKHIIPGHGPLAGKKEVELLLKIERYFNREVGDLVRKGLGIDAVLKDLEPRLPEWITRIPLVWGTPRYAILRVYRGLTRKASDVQPGWQQYKPSAIPAADPAVVARNTSGKETFQDFLDMAHQAQEGGDAGLRLSILKKATQVLSRSPEAYAAYADTLIEVSRIQDSVLEKGDFFQEARNAWKAALSIDPAHPGALLGLGRYHTMMAYRGGDDPSPGMKILERVLELSPTSAQKSEVHFYLGMGYRRLGDEKKAHARFKLARESNPAFMPALLAAQV